MRQLWPLEHFLQGARRTTYRSPEAGSFSTGWLESGKGQVLTPCPPHIHRQLRLLGLHCRAFLGLQKAGVLMPQQYLKQLRTIPLSNGSEITGSSSIPNTDLSLFLSSPHSKSRDTSTSPTKEVSQVDCLPTTLFAFPWPTVPSHHTGISCTSTTVSCPWARRPGHPSPPAPHAPAMLVSTAAL